MNIKRYVMAGLVGLLVLAGLPVPLSAQEDDREDMLLVMEHSYTDMATLYRVSSDGSFSQVLGDIYNPRSGEPTHLAISPDEEWILFQDPDQHLHRVHVNGTDDQQLSENPAWELIWSPDNRWLIFRQCDEGCDLYAMDWDAEDITIHRLTNLEAKTIEIGDAWGDMEREVWSPDGQWLVFADATRFDDEGSLYRVDINEPDQVQQITDLPGREEFVGWGGDGQWLVYASILDEPYSKNLYSVTAGEAMGNASRLITENCSLTFHNWSQDRQWLILSACDCGMNKPTLKGLYLGDKLELVSLTESLVAIDWVAWTIENEEFVFLENNQVLNIQLNMADPQNSMVTKIGVSTWYGSRVYSPDDGRVYLWGRPVRMDDDIPFSLYRMYPDGTDAELVFDLGDSGAVAFVLGWTLDRQWMVLQTIEYSYDKGGNDSVRIHMVRPDGSEAHPVVEWENIWFENIKVDISPDGQWVYFQDEFRASPSPEYLIHLDPTPQGGYPVQPMILPDGFDWVGLDHVEWSSDGKWVIWSGEVYSEFNGLTFAVLRSPVVSPELQFIHAGRLAGHIRASR